jgi:ankyrin repeat protein
VKKIFLALTLISPYSLAMDAALVQLFNRQLWHALQTDDLEGIQEALNNGADADILDDFDNKPDLFALVKAGATVEEFKGAISKGADLNTLSRGDTILHYLVRKKRVDLIKVLLDVGANPNVLDQAGNSPLCYAVRGVPSDNSRANKRLVKILLDAGAELMYADIDFIEKQDLTNIFNVLREKRSKDQEAANIGLIVKRNQAGAIISSNLYEGKLPAEIINEILNRLN